MSITSNLNKRISYLGGQEQELRMNEGKLRSLKRALLYSYQAQTAILEDEREFKCLINHDKLKEDYDDKIISIPYADVCLNAADPTEIQDIGMKVGDVFTWKETNTHWIVIQEILEENAYFRATIRKAEDTIVINNKSYYGYLGKWSKDDLWHTKKLLSWSEMGYEVVLYITRNEDTEGYFERFKKIEINNRLYEVQMVNDITSDTLLIIYLKETFTNEFEDAAAAEIVTPTPTPTPEESDEPELSVTIEGDSLAYPFDKKVYNIKNANGGMWKLSNNKAVIDSQTDANVYITIVSAKSGSIDLIYSVNNEDIVSKTITIKSL